MSHFTVMVVGENIEQQMAPYAEQDPESQYLQFEDTEESNLEEYLNEKVEIVVLSDGTIHSKYEDQFRNNAARDYVYPKDSILREGNYTEIYSTFEEFMEGWHSNSERDEKTNRYGYWTNPNAKWDWYSIGGRWTGYFKPKKGAEGKLGVSGAFDNTPNQGWVDSLKVKDIDITAMLEDSIKEANKVYDELEVVLKGRSLPSWNKTLEKYGEDIDSARNEYNNLELVKELNNARFWSMGDLVDTFTNSREEYVDKCKQGTMVPYAIVRAGKWYQKGEMGWFGMSSNEMTQNEWNKQFWEMMNSLDPETKVTLLDCHI